jgi:hypothetical protein
MSASAFAKKNLIVSMLKSIMLWQWQSMSAEPVACLVTALGAIPLVPLFTLELIGK